MFEREHQSIVEITVSCYDNGIYQKYILAHYHDNGIDLIHVPMIYFDFETRVLPWKYLLRSYKTTKTTKVQPSEIFSIYGI